MKFVFYILNAGFLLAIVACAPISEEGCKSGNWARIGYSDGLKGAYPSRFSEYQEACAEYGVAPVEAHWRQGRDEGLKSYCTKENAYILGRRGREIHNVCSNMGELQKPNRLGLRAYDLEERIDDLKDERRELIWRVRREFSGDLTREEYLLRRKYIRLIDDIEDQIKRLEYELDDYPRI